MWLVVLIGDVLLALFGDLFVAILNALPGRAPRQPASLEDVQRRYAKSVVRRATLAERWADTPERKAVAFVVSNRLGLSFRDHHGAQAMLIAPAAIDRLEPLDAEDEEGRYIAVRGHDGLARVVFCSPAESGDVIADLTSALRA